MCTPYDQVIDVLNTARAAGLKVSVVTNSPSKYAEKLLRYFDLKVDYLVAYHDVRQPKPSQEGVQKVLARFGLRPDEAVYLGNSGDDFLACQAASVKYFAVEWSDTSGITEEHLGVSRLLEFVGLNVVDGNTSSSRSEVIQDGNHFFLGYYLAGVKQEIWSFKDGYQPAIDRWLSKVQDVSKSLPPVDYVVRALGHAEMEPDCTASDKPLDQLSLLIANSLGASYAPNLLRKKRALVKSTQCSGKERKLQVDGAYSVSSDVLTASKGKIFTFMIVDDVLTSGATTKEVERALRDRWPNARIHIFTLVKTLYRSQSSEASAESQHNAQLFADLYAPVKVPEAEFSCEDRPTASMPNRFGLTSKVFSANYCKTNHNFIFHNLKSFSIASEVESKPILSAIYVLKNILQRGKPTIASRRLRQAFGHVDDCNAQALISENPVTWKRLIRGDIRTDQFPARRFFDELMPKYFGEYAFIKQLTIPEVQIFDMTQVYVDRFNNRQVDFYIPQVGLIIEVDGAQHRYSQDSDNGRDTFTQSLGLKTVRFTTQEIASENGAFLGKIREILDHIRTIETLENEGLLLPPNGLTIQHYREALSKGVDRGCSKIRLTAAIRFQILILELIERGDIRLGRPTQAFIINRDKIDFVSCAIQDLADYIKELMALMGIEGRDLILDVAEVDSLSSIAQGIKIDFSILERFDDAFQTEPEVIFARTHYYDFYRHFSGSDSSRIESFVLEDYDYFEISSIDPITYSLDLSPGGRQREALKFFLTNLFLPMVDNADFREGQIGIIGSALARKNTIGLLPTGSGKSICYQLSAILQPAISFVVCPIKSLMYDQKFDLDNIGFTRCNFITGDMKPEQKAKVQRDYGAGKYFFVFISPERFQTSQFRSEMRSIGLDRSFAYSVIDEAHCLSEWGHDFRTSYLNLSNAIRRLAPDSSCIALTATASVNVLKDIQTEFVVPDENVRTPLDFARDELCFHVIDDKGRKGDAAVALVKNMEEKWNSVGCDKAGIVFTATVNGDKGCFDLAGNLSQSLGMDVRYFSGSSPKKSSLRGDAFEAYKQGVQRDFKDNKYRLLTATKAFGMGVNKGNVAYTIHFGIPGSMEALYQEAGRAGREKGLFQNSPADCYVLLTKEKNTVVLDRIWDASAKVTDLKSNLEGLSRGSDIKTNLWLQINSLDTVNDEYKLISSIYSVLEQNRELERVVIRASDFKAEKFKFERAVYRLYQLGIVLDWMVEDFFKGVLDVQFSCLDDSRLQENLESTIRKYEPGFMLDDLLSSANEFHIFLNDRLKKGSLNRTQYVFLVLLVWSYDHFAYNRRQSLKTVYEQCADLAEGRVTEREFKSRLEGYFKFNNSTLTLHSLAENAADSSQWLSVLFEQDDLNERSDAISVEKLASLKEQLSRFLESYKDNPCLNYISGVLRLASDQFDDADGERRMARALDYLASRSIAEVEQVVRETLRLRPLFSIESQCRFARLINEMFSSQSMLEMINMEFQDPYTCGVLLDPMILRLQSINDSYKGIMW
ncbi:MAG: RecQ family ATP-dependent DNA helicase [Alcanivoracaceae bacterium]|nr:RecQ family ATP-dependent DNA helicase [Alcanivoracaceae bacterium]